MTKGQKISAKRFYNSLVLRNSKTGYFSDITVNITGNYCFQYEMNEEFSSFGLTLKHLIEENDFEVIQNKVNPNKFLAIYNGCIV